MEKKIIVAVLFFLVFISSYSQNQFIKVFDTHQNVNYVQVQMMENNSFIVLDIHNHTLIKYEECGKVEWSKKIHLSSLHELFVSSSNDIYILSRGADTGGTNGYNKSVVTKLSSNGSIKWSKMYGDNTFNHYTYSLQEDSQGNIVFYSNMTDANNPNYNLLAKINPQGDVIWSKKYNYGYIWGNCIATSDQGFLFREGNIFNKVDLNGVLQWAEITYHDGTMYGEPIEVSDGYIFPNGSGDDYFSLDKIDKSGESFSNSLVRTTFKETQTNLITDEHGNIIVVVNETWNNPLYQKPVVLTFDKNLHLLFEYKIDLPFMARKITMNENGYLIAVGSSNENHLVVASILHAEAFNNCLMDSSTVSIESDTSWTANHNTFVSSHTLLITDLNTTMSLTNVDLYYNSPCSSPVLELGEDTTICDSVSFTLKNQFPYDFESYRWSTGEINPSITVNEDGTYWVVGYYNCMQDSIVDSISIQFLSSPTPDIPGSVNFCEDTVLNIEVTQCKGCHYLWSTGDTTQSIQINRKEEVWVEVIDVTGCTIKKYVNIGCDCDLMLPNIFTPNSDLINDELHIDQLPFRHYTYSLFNRWGKLVFTTINIFDSESLEELVDGTYYYTIEAQNYCKVDVTYKGWIQISR